MKQQYRLVQLWLALVERIRPYLVSPIGVPRRRWRVLVYAAAHRGPLVRWNRYPRQVIGVGIRLPDLQPPIGSGWRHAIHPRLSIVWSTPHAARRWR